MRVLVGGGTGFIGSHLRRYLEQRGHEMITLTRKAKTPSELTWASIETNGLPSGLDSVVNLAGVNIMSPVRWTEKFKSELISSRVNTTKVLCDAVRKADEKPKSFISASAIGYYGTKDTGEDMTEDSLAGEHFTSKLCEQWEAAADLSGTDVRTVILRIGLVMGRDGGMMQSLYWPFFFNTGGIIGSGKQWFPWIHALDVAGIIVHSIEKTDVNGVLNVVSPQPATNADFTRELSRSMWRFAPFPLPSFVLNTIFGSERAEMLLESPKIVPKRTLETGYRFVYNDLKSACADCVQWGSYEK